MTVIEKNVQKKKEREKERERKEEQVRVFLSRYLEQIQPKLELGAKNCEFFCEHPPPIAFAYIYIIDQKFEITFLDCLLI